MRTSLSQGTVLPARRFGGEQVGRQVAAEEIWAYDPELVHGLLQTPAYVRAVVSAAQPGCTPTDLDRFVDLRQARQDKLHGDKPPTLNVVLGEGALRRVIGGPEIMTEQLVTLTRLAEQDHINLRVLPFAAGAHPAMVSPFILLRFDTEPDNMDVVYLEHDTGALYLERPADIDRYTWIFTEITKLALDEEESRRLIATVKSHL